MFNTENKNINEANLYSIRKNIKCVIDGSNKGNSYFNYETDTFIFFVEKYSDIVYEYSEEIFLVYVKYFENLYNMCRNKKFIDTNCYSYYMANLNETNIDKDKIKNLFDILFKNPKNIINKENLKFFAFAKSGHDIIRCYIESRKRKFCFTEIETMIFMNCISENPIWELSESLIDIINTYNVFSYNDNLLIYASYIPLNNYIKKFIKKKNNKKENTFQEKFLQNILIYSNDIELCNYIINYLNDNIYVEYACESRNIKVIKTVLDAKLIPMNNLFEKIISFDHRNNENITESNRLNESNSYNFKIFKVNGNEEHFLYSELDQYNSNKDMKCLLIRKIKKSDVSSKQDIVYILEKYGMTYTNPNYLYSIRYKIIITPMNLELFNNNDKFREEFLNECSENSFYPYFFNNQYPKPDKYCLYKECKKKNNLKIIKLLSDKIIDPDLECLRTVCDSNYNNLNVIKYFIEKKNIKPDLSCIENSLKNNCDLNILFENINENNIHLIMKSCDNQITKYLYDKFISNKK